MSKVFLFCSKMQMHIYNMSVLTVRSFKSIAQKTVGGVDFIKACS